MFRLEILRLLKLLISIKWKVMISMISKNGDIWLNADKTLFYDILERLKSSAVYAKLTVC